MISNDFAVYKFLHARNSYLIRSKWNDSRAHTHVSWKWKLNWDIGSDEMKFSVGQVDRRISTDLGHTIFRLIIRTWYEHQHYPHDPHQALHHVIVSRPPHFFSPSCAADPSVFALQRKRDVRSIVETFIRSRRQRAFAFVYIIPRQRKLFVSRRERERKILNIYFSNYICINNNTLIYITFT